MNYNGNLSSEQVRKIKKFGKRIGIIVAVLLFVFIVGLITFRWLRDYLWMDTLGFGKVFTTIFSSKIFLGLSGYLLFGIITFITLFWIRHSYLDHLVPEGVPP